MKKIIITIIASLILSNLAYAFDSFVVQKIEVRGLQRITRGTVLNYLPIRVGEHVTADDTAHFIRALYQTGFFTDVSIDHRGRILIINVKERPTIANVRVTGNKDIPKDKFDNVLRDLGIVQGRVYNQSILDSVRQELKSVYNARGKYNSQIEIHTKKLVRNRVAVHIDINEGNVAKIREINIIGNHAFSTRTLLSQVPMTTPGLFTFFTHKDEYTREKLRASEEALKTYYMNRGFIKMEVVSAKVSITPDRSSVYITIKIKENGRYTFSGYKFTGQTVLPKSTLDSYVKIKPGLIFSRQIIINTVAAITDALGEEGYGFPLVNPLMRYDEEHKTVFVNFMVKPGVKVYVRRVNFAGNTRTADTVLRYAIRQHEGQLISLSKIKESERQLRILPYLKNVKVNTRAVPGTNNQVDLTYHVEEANSAQFNLQLGYSTAEKFLLSASISEPNFLGSGRSVSLNFSNSKASRTVSFSYFDPYYGEFGLGRGFSMYYNRNTPDKLNTISPYSNNRYGGMLTYRYLLNDHNSFQWGAGYEHLVITQVSPLISQYVAFVTRYGTRFNQFRFTASWDHNSYDTFPFPTKGSKSQFTTLLSLPAGKGLKYYKLSYLGRLYYPITHGFIFSLRGGLVFGNGLGGTDGLPFYENSFAGGIGSFGQARGYETFSLGPRDFTPRAQPIGGNLLVSGSASIILPYPLSRESFRSSLFIDAANVYAHDLPGPFQGTDPGAIRVSAGVGLVWQSPFGPLQFSMAWPLNKQPGDRKEPFQFSIASGF